MPVEQAAANVIDGDRAGVVVGLLGLVLGAEVAAAGLLAGQRIAHLELGELHEVRHSQRLLEGLVEAVAVAQDLDVGVADEKYLARGRGCKGLGHGNLLGELNFSA